MFGIYWKLNEPRDDTTVELFARRPIRRRLAFRENYVPALFFSPNGTRSGE